MSITSHDKGATLEGERSRMWNNWEMMRYNYSGWGHFWSTVSLLLVWSLFWKGLALWKAARNDSRYWFITLLIVNTGGILELLYLFVFAKNKFVLVSEARPTVKAPTRKTTKK